MNNGLTQEQVIAVLDEWVDSTVTIRVVGDDDELLAVFEGKLDARSNGKRPALFWPLRTGAAPHPEEPGVYLHPERFEEAVVQEGQFVVELRQAAVRLNIRRL